MEINALYPTKGLRYEICNFLLDKRRKTTGLGSPLRIRFRDLESLFDYASGSKTEEKLYSIADELLSLDRELFGNQRKVIKILDTSIINNIADSFKNNLIFSVVCSSKDIEDYICELKERTRVAIRNEGLSEIETLPTGGIKIILGDREMKVNKSKNDDKDLCINIVKLMYGEKIKTYRQSVFLKDYERRDHISFSDLSFKLNKVWDDEQDTSIKPIKDAVRNINSRAKNTLGYVLFEVNNEGIKLVL